MAGRIWNREQHLRRKTHTRLTRQVFVHPKSGPREPEEVRAAFPRTRWVEYSFFETAAEAQYFASTRAGARVQTKRAYRRPESIQGFSVGYDESIGAAFREPVMTWALEEKTRMHLFGITRKWVKKGGLKGGVGDATRPYRRRWRRAGHNICRLARLGDMDRAEELDPQPQRRGVMWMIW
ncbi:hypothetical protein [Deinococcus maricopensis]|uniref:hypothetical protein n=1 Tax=Deinococcus maricopensis TaxID=309887 RepID=UPI0011D27657|nr:hypothetical protein [Deinococcus maricopensis]